MAGPSVLNDTSDLEELSKPQGLFLKPIARLNISVQLPHLTEPGKTISNWEVMEKMKGMAKPDNFTMIKVAKSTMDFVRFEAEVESKSILKNVLTRIDGGTIKLSGFTEILKVKAAEAKLPFPVRHDWDSFFRDSKDMNEMVPGERPDTIHLELLPCKWFYDQRFNNANRPSPHVLQKVFESFGEIRCVDIPVLDPYRRNNMKEAKTFSSFDAHLTFEAYIQYVEYISFVKAMDALRGMKLVFREKPHLVIPKKSKESEERDGNDHEGNSKEEEGKEENEGDKSEDWKAALDLSDEEGKKKGSKEKPEETSDDKKDEGTIRLEPRCWMADIKVDFNKTKHLTDEKLQKRKARMEKFIRDQKEKVEKEQKRREDEARRREEEILNKEQAHLRQISEKEAKRHEREEKRRKKRHEQKIAIKIATEERKILIASRKLETIRLLEELFNRIRLVKHQEQVEQRMLKLEEMKKKELDNAAERQLKEEARKLRREEKRRQKLLRMEEVFKKRLVLKMKAQQEKQKEINREKARLEIQVKGSKLSSAASIAVVPAAVVHPVDSKASKKPRRVDSHGVMAREKLHEDKHRDYGNDRGRREGYEDHRREGYEDHRREGHEDHRREGYEDHRREGYEDHRREGYEDHRRKRKVEQEAYDSAPIKKERHRRGEEEEEPKRSQSRGKSREQSRSKSRGKSHDRRDSSGSERDGDEKRESDKETREDDIDHQELINKITSEVGGEPSTLLYGKSLSDPKPSTSNAVSAPNRGRGNFMNRGRGRNVFGKFDPNMPPNMRGRGRGFFPRGRGRGRGFYPRKNFGQRDDEFMRKYYRMPGQQEERSESDDSDEDDDSDDEREGKSSRRHKKKRDDSDVSDDSSDDDSDEEGAEKRKRRPKQPKKLPLVPMDRPIPVPQQYAYRGMGRPRGYYEFPPDRRPHFFSRGGYNHGGDYDGGRPPMPLYRRRQDYDEGDFRDDGSEFDGRDHNEEEPRRRDPEEPRRRVERETSTSKKHKKHKKHKKRKSKETSNEGSDDSNDQADGGDSD